MKKISFTIDEDTDRLLKTLAWIEDISKSELVRRIIRKEAKDMAYRHGILNRHEIEEYINK